MKHKDLVNFYLSYSCEIEEGFRAVSKEFGIGNGKIDIVGIDRDRNLCLVEVKTRKASIQDELQVKHYRSIFLNLFRLLGIDKTVRVIVIEPSRIKDLGKIKSIDRMNHYSVNPARGTPTSREIYGLKPLIASVPSESKPRLSNNRDS